MGSIQKRSTLLSQSQLIPPDISQLLVLPPPFSGSSQELVNFSLLFFFFGRIVNFPVKIRTMILLHQTYNYWSSGTHHGWAINKVTYGSVNPQEEQYQRIYKLFPKLYVASKLSTRMAKIRKKLEFLFLFFLEIEIIETCLVRLLSKLCLKTLFKK